MARIHYNPFDGGPYKMRMGITPLDGLAEWITVDEEFATELALKRDLLRDERDAVLAVTPGSEPACAEVLELLADHLPRQFPDVFTRDGGRLTVLPTGETWTVDPPEQHPLELAGRLVQEDLCVMEENDGGDYVLTAANLCFPSFWRLAEKIGRPLHEIHGPVPDLAQTIGGAMSRFFKALAVDRPVQRLNASIAGHPDLFQPASKGERNRLLVDRGEINPDNAGETIYFRMERQTLRRLPRTGAILFTIHIYRYKLDDLAQRPDMAAGFATYLRTLTPGMTQYKAADILGPAALAALDRIVAQAADKAAAAE
ncbi:heme-dependent oxidative N-demethylase family protein [Zavarzinia sp. CC-PAN008]|uniref:heme-dependent oxidative N-demethylase family protein n=1 Tax=Zavarzinia sp. CC-PAN008 TaxID=3243332 RepID=UPI003F745CAA